MSMPFLDDVDLGKNALINAVMHPLGADPVSPEDGQLWYRTDTDRLRIQRDGAVRSIAYTTDVPGNAVLESDYNAQTVLVAVADDTPVATVIPEGQMLGRPSGGNVSPMNAAAILTLLGVEAGATADQSAAEIIAAVLTVDGPGSGLNADLLDGNEATHFATAAQVALKADTTYVDAEISALLDGAPAALDTLNELAAALNDNASFAANITALIDAKPGKFAVTIGDGSTTALTVTHNLATTDVVVEAFYVASNKKTFFTSVERPTTNTVELTFKTAPATNSVRVVVLG